MPAGQIDGEGELDEKEIESVALRELHDSALRLVDETQFEAIHAEGAAVVMTNSQ